MSVYPGTQTVVASSNVTFQCVVRSDPSETLSVQLYWRRDNQWLVTNDLCIDRCLVTKFDGHKSSLLVTDVSVADSGQYVCRAISSVDVTDATAALFVKGRFRFLHLSLSLSTLLLPNCRRGL